MNAAHEAAARNLRYHKIGQWEINAQAEYVLRAVADDPQVREELLRLPHSGWWDDDVATILAYLRGEGP